MKLTADWQRVLRHALANLSVGLNRLAGGAQGENLCAGMAKKHGVDCRFCVFIGWVLREPEHCEKQLEE